MCARFVDVSSAARPCKVVADTANGMGGLIAPARLRRAAVRARDPLSASSTGPSRTTPPTRSSRRTSSTCAPLILERGADVGLAFDGDADRVFLVDELGEPLSGSTTTAIVAEAMLEKHPGSTILYNLHLLAVGARGHQRERRDPDPHARRALLHQGGHGRDRRGLRRRALGPLLLPGQLPRRLGDHRRARRARGALQGGPAPLAAAQALRALRRLRRDQHPGRTTRRPSSARSPSTYRAEGAEIDDLDGLTVDLGDWWFNLRPSNTEPLLRLNVEAPDAAQCAARVAEVLALVRGAGGTERRS